jgi:hypothetical protein
MKKHLVLGHREPTLNSPQRTNWVGLNLEAFPSLRKGGNLLLGHECKSTAELEGVVAKLKLELEEIIQTAKF